VSNAFLLFVWEVSSKSTALQILQEVSLMARKLTVLTVPEEKAWQWAFEFYVNDGLTERIRSRGQTCKKNFHG